MRPRCGHPARVLGVIVVVMLGLPASAQASFGAPFGLSSHSGGSDIPRVAVDPTTGQATVVWKDHDSTNYRVTAQSVAAGGTLGTAESLSPAGGDADKPQVAVDPSTGASTVVWLRFDGTAWRVQACMVAADGTIGAVKTLSAAGEFADGPDVAVDSSTGTATVVWVLFNGAIDRVQERTFAANGTLGTTKTLSPTTGSAAFVHVGIDSATGNATVVWHRFDGSNLRIQGRTVAAGGTLGPIKTLSTAGQSAQVPEVAVDPSSGTATVVWYRSDGSDFRIQARTLASDGTLGTIKTLSAAGGSAQFPQIALDSGTGTATIAWQRTDTSGNERVQVRTLQSNGTLGTTKTLSAAGENAENPQVGVASSGGLATVVWQRSDGTNWRVEARTVAANGTLGAVQTLSASGKDGVNPDVGVDTADGSALAVWAYNGIGIQGALGP